MILAASELIEAFYRSARTDRWRNIPITLIDPERGSPVRKTSIASLILTRASSSRIVDCLAQMYYVSFLTPYLYRSERCIRLKIE